VIILEYGAQKVEVKLLDVVSEHLRGGLLNVLPADLSKGRKVIELGNGDNIKHSGICHASAQVHTAFILQLTNIVFPGNVEKLRSPIRQGQLRDLPTVNEL